MPQFDTYSFFSQIFWVLLFFTILYLSFSYYLLPSIAVILKVRKRKLMNQGTATQDSSLANSSFGFSSQLQLFINAVDSKQSISKENTETSLSSFNELYFPIEPKLVINSCNKEFSLKNHYSFFNISYI